MYLYFHRFVLPTSQTPQMGEFPKHIYELPRVQIAIGYDAGEVTTGAHNVAIGNVALLLASIM